MADSNGFEKLLRNMSNIPEEDDLEIDEHLNQDRNGVISVLNENDKLEPPITVELANINSSESENGNIINSSITGPNTDDLKETDSRKIVRFIDGNEIVDSYSKEATSPTLNVDTPVHYIIASDNAQNNKETSKDSIAFMAVPTDNNTSDSNLLDKTLTVPRPFNLRLPNLFAIKEALPSATETTPTEGETTGRRHFEVSNVDESVLRNKVDNTIKEEDLNNMESDIDNRPLLEKRSSSLSDSDHSTYTANMDTIGPLENPYFLKMLNYSVSNVIQDDGFKGTSNLDLTNFTQPMADMDGGWAWVVLFAAFFSLSLTGATTYAAGVLMSAILRIDPDRTKASWIGAVHVSVLCMSGPFVGIVLNRLGARLTAFLAGLVLATGLIAASFCSTIIQLIFTHGLIAGIGSGFILNTMFVTVGQYFNRYRGLACGLLATGSGVGMLAGGNALTALFNSFGLSGTYLLWGGVTLHSLIFAMLLRPSPAEQLRAAEKAKKNAPKIRKGQSFQGDISSMRSGSIFSGRTNSFRRSQKSTGKTDQQEQGVAPLLKSVLHKDVSRSTFSLTTNQSIRSHRKSNLNIQANPAAAQNKAALDSSTLPTLDTASLTQRTNAFTQDKTELSTVGNARLLDSSPLSEVAEAKAAKPSSPTSLASPTYSHAPSEFNRSFRKRLISGSSKSPSQYTSAGRLSYRPSIREQLQRNDLDNESLASTLVSHLQPQDALSPRYRLGSRSVSSMFGSFASLPTALVIIKDDLSQIDTTDGPKKKESTDIITRLLDSLQLLKNKPFLVFISTCLLWALADSPFSLYLPAYAMSKGSTLVQASSLYTGMGFGSMCGRFLSGLVASNSDIGPILFHIGCLSIASVVVGLSPWITSTYLEQMVCAGLFGLYTGSLVPLSSLITIELLGIEDLGLGFGFLSMAQGIGYLAGPPLLGIVIQAVGYEMSFRIAGLVLLSASLLAMVIAVLIKKDKEENIHESLDALDRALGRISDIESDDDNEIFSYQEEDPCINPKTANDSSNSNLKNKEQQATLADKNSLRDGDQREEPKLKPLSEANTACAIDLGIISEEA